MKTNRINVFDSKNGNKTLTVDGILLHSSYDPYSTALNFIDNNSEIYLDKKTIVVYGLGFGYHISALLSRVDNDCNIYVFEADLDVYNIGKKYKVYESLKKDPRVNIVVISNNNFFELLKSKLNQVENIYLYTPSMNSIPEQFSSLKNVLFNFKIAVDGINESGSIMEENSKVNESANYPTISDFYRDYKFENESIIIASAGPSLDLNIENLKKLQHKFKIFCVGSALRTLIKHHIVPYMICIIDSQQIVQQQLRGLENINIPLCFLNTASRWAVSNYNGPKYIFFNNVNQFDDIIINTGKTVAIPTIDIAVQGRVKEVILVGQDLAFIDGKSHTDSINESYHDIGITNKVNLDNPFYKEVISVNGKILYTNSEYLNFKYFIELEIANNPHVNFFNASSGAKILGTTEITLSNLI